MIEKLRLGLPAAIHAVRHLPASTLPSSSSALTTQHPSKPRGAAKGHKSFCYRAQLQLLHLLLCPLITNETTIFVDPLLELGSCHFYVANSQDRKREKGGKKSILPRPREGSFEICRNPSEAHLKSSQVMLKITPVCWHYFLKCPVCFVLCNLFLQDHFFNIYSSSEMKHRISVFIKLRCGLIVLSPW